MAATAPAVIPIVSAEPGRTQFVAQGILKFYQELIGIEGVGFHAPVDTNCSRSTCVGIGTARTINHLMNRLMQIPERLGVALKMRDEQNKTLRQIETAGGKLRTKLRAAVVAGELPSASAQAREPA